MSIVVAIRSEPADTNLRLDSLVVFRVAAFGRRVAETVLEAPDTLGFCSRAAGPLTGRCSPFAFEALAVARASLFAGSWDSASPTLIAGPKVPRGSRGATRLLSLREIADFPCSKNAPRFCHITKGAKRLSNDVARSRERRPVGPFQSRLSQFPCFFIARSSMTDSVGRSADAAIRRSVDPEIGEEGTTRTCERVVSPHGSPSRTTDWDGSQTWEKR